jgi:hypothetical protein
MKSSVKLLLFIRKRKLPSLLNSLHLYIKITIFQRKSYLGENKFFFNKT